MIITKPRLITPMSDFLVGVSRSNCRNSDLCDHLRRLSITLPEVTEPKSVRFICLSIPVQQGTLVKLLEKEKTAPCRSGANYFLGYLREITERDVPPEIQECHFVAYDPESTIVSSTGLQAFLCCRRDGKRTRNLDIAFGTDGWADRWAFLVEDAVAVSKPVEPANHLSATEDTTRIYTEETTLIHAGDVTT